MSKNINGPHKLDEFPLGTVGDGVLDLVRRMTGVTTPVCFIVVGDFDTGEIASSGNIDEEQIMHLLKFLIAAHENEAYDVHEEGETIQ